MEDEKRDSTFNIPLSDYERVARLIFQSSRNSYGPVCYRSLFPSRRGNGFVSLYLEHRRRARRMLIFVEQSRCISYVSLFLSPSFSFRLRVRRNRSHLMDNSSSQIGSQGFIIDTIKVICYQSAIPH